MPNIANIDGVIFGNIIQTKTRIMTNSDVFHVKGANTKPSVMTVPKSVMKQAARIVLPNSPLLKPYSIITV